MGYSGDGGLATAASLDRPQGLAVDRGGNIYVADTGNNALRFFTIGGPISTLAGNGTAGFTGDNNPAAFAQLSAPTAVGIDLLNNIYIADTGNSVIRKISNLNQISSVAGSYGTNGNTGDGGAAATAGLLAPSDLAIDTAGDLYIASGGSVRLVNSDGFISTMAGVQGGSYSGEGGPSTSAILGSSRLGLMLDGSANLYISDTEANRLLKVSTSVPPSLTFSKQEPGTTGSAQIISILNSGNSTLTLSNLSVAANYILQTNDFSACTPTTTLAAGQNCSLTIAFSPAAATVGTVNGAVVLTDNALTIPGTSQTISLVANSAPIAETTTTLSISPASLIYGASATATATVTGSGSPTGTVIFTADGVNFGSAILTSGKAAISFSNFPAGPIALTASYMGDSNNSSSSGLTNATIKPAVLTVTATNTTRAYRALNPVFAYTVSGFVNGDIFTVVSGAPLETTPAITTSPAGAYDIVGSLGTLSAANYTFSFAKGTLTILPPPPADFTLSVTPTTLVLFAGLQGTETITLKSINYYSGTAQLSSSNLPQNVSCSFVSNSIIGNPDGVDQSATTTLNISTDLLTASTGRYEGIRPGSMLSALSAPFLFMGIILLSKRKRRLPVLLGIASLIFVTLGFTSCSGTGPINHVAVAGTSQITITATDSASKLTRSSTITLTIQ